MSSDSPEGQPARLRPLVEGLVCAVAAVVMLRTWLIEGLLIPCHVTSGSMAPTLLGPHWRVKCGGCGEVFAVGAEPSGGGLQAVCSHCAGVGPRLESVPLSSGDRLMMDKSAFHLRRPKRWEVVALRGQRQANSVEVKRVVGLPGESVQIRHGDVYINGEVARKTLRQQRAVALLVHEARGGLGLAAAGLVESERDSRWAAAQGRFRHPLDAEEKVDWLEYRHRGLRSAAVSSNRHEQRAEECPVDDQYSYNQARPRRRELVNPVSDLFLSFRVVHFRGGGRLSVAAIDGQHRFELRIDPMLRRYEAFHNRRVIPGGSGKLPSPLVPLTVEISLVDQQLLVAFNGQVAGVPYPYRAGRGAGPPPTSRPLAIGAAQLEVEITQLRVYRDLYYTAAAEGPGCWDLENPVKLGEDQYYVLGDNSPVSCDSRTWVGGPAVAARFLVGKPLLVHYPAIAWKLGRWVFQVPDVSRIRYIR